MSVVRAVTAALTVFVWIVAGLLAVNLSRSQSNATPSVKSERAAAVPYTVVVKETIRWPNGRSSPAATFTHAVRRDGSILFVWDDTQSRPPGQQAHVREIQFASGVAISVDEIRELKSTSVAMIDTRRKLRNPSAECIRTLAGTVVAPSEHVGGREEILGHPTIRIVDGGRTSWHAVDLGCAVLKTTIDFRSSISEQVADTIRLGEPSAELFDVPVRFTEVPPSVLYQAKPGSPGAIRRDRYYEAHRPK